MNPPQTAYLIYPFLRLGERWSAFWNLFMIMVILIGDPRQLSPAFTRLLILFTAPLFIVAAAANFAGIATGIGLLLLLTVGRGWLRGVGWAYMLTRPQDTVIILLYELITSLRQRDWRAYVTCAAMLLIPVFQYGPLIYFEWLKTPAISSKNLGLVEDSIILAVLFVAFIFTLRLVTWREGALQFRRWGTLPQTEQFWLLTVIGHIMGPYTGYYMLWMFLLPVREYRIWRTLVLFVGLTIIGVMFFTAANREIVQQGMLIMVTFIALLSPHTDAAPEQ